MKLVTLTDARCRIAPQTLLEIARFAVQSGEHWCVFGPNGAGKTTLGRLLTGQMRESARYVRYADQFQANRDIHLVSFEEQQRLWQRDDRFDISDYSESAQDQGTRVEDLIRSSRSSDAQDEDLLSELLRELALEPQRQQGIRFLSSGQMRKAMLARALYARHDQVPQLIVLDDPLESIDRDSRGRIEATIGKYLTTTNASIQFCRRQQDIPDYATHVAVMSGLRMTAQGEREALLQSTAFATVANREVPRLTAVPQDTLHALPALDQQQPLLELRRVNASYGDTPILREVTWQMLPTHHTVIEGPNGCGKSTLLSLIDGENHKGYGQELTLFGRRKGSGEAVWDIKARFGVVSNELHNKYVKGWRVLEVVVSGFFSSVGLYDNSGSAETTIAQRWLQALGLGQQADAYYHTLSFGQQRLVLLARAMVKSPTILILDEPCVGLDDYHRELILQLLDLIAGQTPTRLIYVSHVIDEQPQCINQRLQFVPHAEGGYTVVVGSV